MPSTRLKLPVVPLRWRMPITIGLIVLMAASLVANGVAATPLTGTHPAPLDSDLFAPGGIDILTGHWVGIFRGAIIQAGPLELIFWGIPYLLGISSVVGWIAFEIVVGSLFSIALAAIAERMLRAVSPLWSVPLGVSVATLTALTGVMTAAISFGHPAEIAVPLLWIIAALLARRGSAFAAAAVLASTAGWELWGLLGLPILLLAPRISVRVIALSAAAGVAVIAVLFLPFALLGPFNMFSFSWPIRDNSLAHLLFPDARVFSWPLRLLQALLSVGGGVATALLLRRRINAVWLVPLAICVIRLFTDPVLAPYYGVPTLMMLALGAALAIAQGRVLIFLACLVMVNVMVDVPINVITAGILVVLTAGVTVLVVRDGRRVEARTP